MTAPHLPAVKAPRRLPTAQADLAALAAALLVLTLIPATAAHAATNRCASSGAPAQFRCR